LRPGLERTGHQHPTIPYILRTRGEQSVQISDFLSQRAYKKLEIYQDFFKHVDTNYQLATLIGVKPSFMVPVCFNRKHRDFKTHDRAQLDLLRPHLVQACRNAQTIDLLTTQLATLDQTLEESGLGVISVTSDGRIRFTSPKASTLLAQFGLPFGKTTSRLPHPLLDWLRHEKARTESSSIVPTPPQPLHLEGERGLLEIRLLHKDSDHLLLLKKLRSQFPMTALYALGLSPRETEILSWVTQGKTNPEIGMILSISRRTVHKHLERIYTRLGVENRHAAISLALTASRSGQ
jgi:DNA-binding CsgD family transcriptional regulator